MIFIFAEPKIHSLFIEQISYLEDEIYNPMAHDMKMKTSTK